MPLLYMMMNAHAEDNAAVETFALERNKGFWRSSKYTLFMKQTLSQKTGILVAGVRLDDYSIAFVL